MKALSRRVFLGRSLAVAGASAVPLHLGASSRPENEEVFSLPELPYAPDALEPYIDERTMRIHHGKHHAGYTRKLNAALAGADARYRALPITELLALTVALPEPLRQSVRENGGGFFNHALFWEVMSPEGGGRPRGALMRAIEADFGSFEAMSDAFGAAALSRFGSGWAWLCVGDDGKLFISSTPNQVNPLMRGIAEKAGTPILGLDVWEHAYYLKYQNRRADYVSAFARVIHWPAVEARHEAARA